jgi:hypothetical protein
MPFELALQFPGNLYQKYQFTVADLGFFFENIHKAIVDAVESTPEKEKALERGVDAFNKFWNSLLTKKDSSSFLCCALEYLECVLVILLTV